MYSLVTLWIRVTHLTLRPWIDAKDYDVDGQNVLEMSEWAMEKEPGNREWIQTEMKKLRNTEWLEKEIETLKKRVMVVIY